MYVMNSVPVPKSWKRLTPLRLAWAAYPSMKAISGAYDAASRICCFEVDLYNYAAQASLSGIVI